MNKFNILIGLILLYFINSAQAFQSGNIKLDTNHGGDGSAWRSLISDSDLA